MQQTLTRNKYTTEEQAAVDQAIEARFGAITQVLEESSFPEICVISGEEGITLVTRGMGAQPMRVPAAHNCDRAELVLRLPPQWGIQTPNENYSWPLRWLKLLAQLPAEENTWLGWGHTVPGGQVFAENTGFDTWLLLDPDSAPFEVDLPANKTVAFYELCPLYPQELQFKLKHGVQALEERLRQAGCLGTLDIARENLFTPAARSILEDWVGAAQCLATNRIMEDGAPVGYCYREAPYDESDSGWRFTAGDESDDYMNDPAQSGVFDLSQIADFDVDILPILQTPAPCAFARGPQGLERVKHILN